MLVNFLKGRRSLFLGFRDSREVTVRIISKKGRDLSRAKD